MEMKTVDRSIQPAPPASRAMILAAFAAIYLIWGSTYLAIKVAIETVPPFLMTGVRFLIAGGVLYAWSVFRPSREAPGRGTIRPSMRRAWRDAFVVGALLIVGGTSLVGWAELSVPSGITSLILATTPLWMVLLDGASSSRAPSGRVLMGVMVGLGGLAILIGPSLLSPGEGVNLLGAGALVLASLTWTTGALYSRRLPHVGSPARTTGMQMIAGAVLSILVGVATGELDRFSVATITTTSVIAVSYLVVAGALVGFSAYLWLMRVAAPSRVATHAYVNPVVAVLLGWAVLGESVTMRTGAAMAVIVAAVVLIVSAPAPDATHTAQNDLPRETVRGWRRLIQRAA
jgi:drug/metabolite transporter (DMT)-like permease